MRVLQDASVTRCECYKMRVLQDASVTRCECYKMRVLQAVDRLFDRCEKTALPTGQPVLLWLHSQHPHISPPRPFGLVGRQSSRNHYRRICKEFVCFLFRLYRIDSNIRQSALKLNLTPSQQDAIETVWNDRKLGAEGASADTRDDVDQVEFDDTDSEDEDEEDEWGPGQCLDKRCLVPSLTLHEAPFPFFLFVCPLSTIVGRSFLDPSEHFEQVS